MRFDELLRKFKSSKKNVEYLLNADEEEIYEIMEALDERAKDLRVIDFDKLDIDISELRVETELDDYMEDYNFDEAKPYIIAESAREKMTPIAYAQHVLAVNDMVKRSKRMEYLGFTVDGWEIHEYYINAEEVISLVYNCYKSESKTLIGGYYAKHYVEIGDIQ